MLLLDNVLSFVVTLAMYTRCPYNYGGLTGNAP